MTKIVENFWILFDSCINTLWFVDPATVYMFRLITVHII